jgi:very-short-patch-repair endonuclease
VPEIIQFSNHLSYNQTIRPLREPLSATVRPALVPHRVNGYRDRGDTNSQEAEEIAALIIACIEQPEYALNEFGLPTTFGIITLLADEQALPIDEILRQRLPDDARQKRRLLCGNAAQFQGDERDVVFLSVVDGPPNDGLLTMRDAGPRDLYKKRYNVAVSRARNQLWVVHSVDPATHLKPGDLRRRLIEHARDPEVLLKLLDREGPRTESLFEKQVLQRLVNAGYRVQTQWQVGASRIDLVVEGTQRRLAVECDGERWHTIEKLHEDMERQAVLERLGWVFVRIRGSLFFRDPDAAMAPLFAKLQQLEIEPLGPVSAPSALVAAHPLVDRVRRRAQELRSQWRAARASNADSSDGESTNGPASPPETAARNLGNHAREPQRMSSAVEVGDSVRYCFADTPNDEAFVTIVPYESNPTLGIINAETAVAKALLGREKGEEFEVALPSGRRRLRVLAVHKHRRG